MPSSPRTPRRSHHSAKNSADSKKRRSYPHSRTSSVGSIQPLVTSPTRVADDGLGDSIAARYRSQETHGSLADELAGALDEEDEGETILERPATSSKVAVSSSPLMTSHPSSNSPQKPRKLDSSQSHGFESDEISSEDGYGDNAVADNFSFLDVHMSALESLVKDFEASNRTASEGSFFSLAQSLKELPTQSVIENGTSRLITTHAALTSHVANQTRSLQSLVHPLVSPFVATPEEDDIDELIPLITSLIAAVPSQGGQCLAALNLLQSLTFDLGQTLTYLSDSIYMMRQNLSSAGRKLRTVADMVNEMKREADAREAAMKWIEKGRWDRKLLDRQCGHVCGEVIGGFEEVCQGWRQRLLAG